MRQVIGVSFSLMEMMVRLIYCESGIETVPSRTLTPCEPAVRLIYCESGIETLVSPSL